MSELVTSGNRNPKARYAGYTNRLESIITRDQKLAWEEGYRARESDGPSKTLCKQDGCNAVNGNGHSVHCEDTHTRVIEQSGKGE